MQPASMRFRSYLWLLFLALSACGGGGGGDSGGSTAPPPAVGSGLVPVAPPLGTTLEADATVLRPLVANGVWTYRGTQALNSGPATVYTNAVTQQASGVGTTSESGTNQANLGSFEQDLLHRSGDVFNVSAVDLGNGQSQAVEQLELRSPVRVNDQYTLFDAGGLDLGSDLDGDGRNELLDLAIYSRVIGEEVMDLVSFPGASAVRVTMTVLTRVRGTRGQTASDSSTLDAWYARGIGIVRIDTDLPGSAGGRILTSERLVNFDGVVRGVGFLPPTPATSPAGVRQRNAVDAIGFDNHALMLSFAGDFAAQGIALSRVDSRGQVQSTQSYTGITATDARLVRIGDVARVVYRDDAGLLMRQFDSSGNATVAVPVNLKPGPVSSSGTNEQFVVAGVGDVMWLAWFEFPATPADDYTLRVRPFGADGQPVGAESVLVTTDNPNSVRDLRANGASGRAVFSWNDGTTNFYALTQGTAVPTLHSPGISMATSASLFPATSSAGGALMWTGAIAASGGRQPFGVIFDSLGEPWFSSGGGAPGAFESLSLPWVSNATLVAPSRGGAGALDVLISDFTKLWPEDVSPANLSVIAEISPANRPLAQSPQAKLLARGALPLSSGDPIVVSLSNNLIVIADETAGITVTSVWRRPQ